MTRCISERNSGGRLICSAIGVAMAAFGLLSDAAYADEGGVSYWLPGRFSSLAATPGVPGWSMAEVYYHTTVSAFGAANGNFNLFSGYEAESFIYGGEPYSLSYTLDATNPTVTIRTSSGS